MDLANPRRAVTCPRTARWSRTSSLTPPHVRRHRNPAHDVTADVERLALLKGSAARRQRRASWRLLPDCLLLMLGVRERPSEALDKLVREVFVGE